MRRDDYRRLQCRLRADAYRAAGVSLLADDQVAWPFSPESSPFVPLKRHGLEDLIPAALVVASREPEACWYQPLDPVKSIKSKSCHRNKKYTAISVFYPTQPASTEAGFLHPGTTWVPPEIKLKPRPTPRILIEIEAKPDD